MTRKQRRATFIVTAVGTLGVALGLVLYALSSSITYFRTPSDVVAQSKAETLKTGQRFRLGGLVKDGTVKRGQGLDVEFAVTDTLETVAVLYRGVLHDLFREGQGVVTEGRLEADGRFRADSVLAKHDENYMPPEVAKSLKDKGVKLGPTAVHPKDKGLK